MPDRAGAGAAAWAGRSYAHLALSVPFLGDAELALLDRAACAADGWRPADPGLTRPILLRRWQRPGGDLLVLVVLGWYPLLVTVGLAPKPRAAGRRALARLTEAVLTAGGRAVGDAELPGLVDAARRRWDTAVAAQRRLEEHRPFLEFRTCRMCPAWSALESPHCRGCGQRFTPADDVERDTRTRAARDVVAAAAAELAALGRGEGLLPDWPRPAPARPAGPGAHPDVPTPRGPQPGGEGAQGRPGRVVA
jgi:hypothetical protein